MSENFQTKLPVTAVSWTFSEICTKFLFIFLLFLNRKKVWMISLLPKTCANNYFRIANEVQIGYFPKTGNKMWYFVAFSIFILPTSTRPSSKILCKNVLLKFYYDRKFRGLTPPNSRMVALWIFTEIWNKVCFVCIIFLNSGSMTFYFLHLVLSGMTIYGKIWCTIGNWKLRKSAV